MQSTSVWVCSSLFAPDVCDSCRSQVSLAYRHCVCFASMITAFPLSNLKHKSLGRLLRFLPYVLVFYSHFFLMHSLFFCLISLFLWSLCIIFPAVGSFSGSFPIKSLLSSSLCCKFAFCTAFTFKALHSYFISRGLSILSLTVTPKWAEPRWSPPSYRWIKVTWLVMDRVWSRARVSDSGSEILHLQLTTSTKKTEVWILGRCGLSLSVYLWK